MAMLCLSFSASAYDFEVDGFYYEVDLEKMTATLVAGENKQSGEVVVPGTVLYKNREFTVKSIVGAFFGNTEITSVVLPNSIIYLGKNAFAECSSLVAITGLENVNELGVSCFAQCESLTSIELPSCLKEIGSEAFCGCSSLSDIFIPEGVTSIESAAFKNCSALSSINLPMTLTKLSQEMFMDCISLNKIELPVTISIIDEGAFKGCQSLNLLTIPSSVSEIRNNSFNGCINLSDIIISDGTETLSVGTNGLDSPLFENCPLNSVYIGRNLKYPLYNYELVSPFSGSMLQNVQIGQFVTKLGERLFEYCEAIKEIVVPRNITEIGYRAFTGCKSITKAVFEDGYTDLCFDNDRSSHTFERIYFMNDSPLTEIYIGRNISYIDSSSGLWFSVFSEQKDLEEILIGDFVSDISCLLNKEKTLSHFPNLKSIRFGVALSFVPDLSENTKLTNLSLTSTNPQNAIGFSAVQFMDLIPNIPIGSFQRMR